MNSITAKRTRDHLRLHLLLDIEPTHFITFNFGWKVRAINAERKLSTFFSALQRKVYGRNWAARTDYPWPVAYGFFEHPDSNPHYHVLARLEPEMSKAASACGKDLWLKRAPRGQLHLRAVDSLPRDISYCTKRYMSDGSYEAVFIYSDTRAPVIP